MHRFVSVLICLLVTSCSAVGVMSSSDPIRKLDDANDLYMRQDRPGPAERLIREALTSFENIGDDRGVGLALREYADFLRSEAVGRWEKSYRKGGFLDPSINFDNRLEKSVEFYRSALSRFERSEASLIEKGQYDLLTNAYMNMAGINVRLGNQPMACKYFDKSSGAHDENVKRNPTAQQAKPPGVNSIPEYIALLKQRNGCP